MGRRRPGPVVRPALPLSPPGAVPPPRVLRELAVEAAGLPLGPGVAREAGEADHGELGLVPCPKVPRNPRPVPNTGSGAFRPRPRVPLGRTARNGLVIAPPGFLRELPLAHTGMRFLTRAWLRLAI